MSPAETSALLAMIRLRWPHSNIDADPRSLHRLWHLELADYDVAAVEAAVRKVGRGREHAPTLDVILAELDVAAQDDAPSFDDAMAILARHTRCLPYRPSGMNPPEDLVVALDALEEAGVPEVVQRFVAAVGVYAICTMPDASRFPLDPNQRAVRRDHSRFYGEKVIPAWRTDPTPGLALRKAEKRFGSVPEERRLRPPERRRTLTPWIDDTAQDPPVDPAQVRQLMARQEMKRI